MMHRWTLDRARRGVLLCLLIVATAGFGWFLTGFYPLRHWLFLFFARCWALSGLFVLSSTVGGLGVLEGLRLRPTRLAERLVLAGAVGVLVFTWGVFIAGLLGAFGPLFFYLWPVVLLAVGARPAARLLRRLRAHSSAFTGGRLVPRRPLEVVLVLYGLLCLLGLYLQIMAPANIGADSHWYHLPLAEHYVAARAIRPFPEGAYVAAYPQLASLLYTWAYQGPGRLRDHAALSTHLEWMLFLLTLAGVACLASRLARRRLPLGGAAMFLFPGVFLYDSNLITAADHVLAFWAPPIALTLLRLSRRFTPREGVLAGLMLAGALLTKVQASYFLAPATLLVAGLALWRRRLTPALAWGTAATLASAAHWLKNWLWYGDPYYPLLHRYFADHPFHPGAEQLLERVFWYGAFLPRGTALERARDALGATVAFSFVPHDWDFHGNIPLFGSLFTLLLPALLLVRAGARTWLLVAGTHVGIVVWFLTSHQDRYLHALVPWMAAVTAAAIAHLWQQGALIRWATAALASLQVIWGADAYFYRVHAMAGDAPLKATVDFIDAGHRGFYDARFGYGLTAIDVANQVPKEAKVLIHLAGERFGLERQTIADAPGWQGAVDYLALETPAQTFALWQRLGATHAAWLSPLLPATPEDLAREAVFAQAMSQYGDPPVAAGLWRVTPLHPTPRDSTLATDPTRILWLGCPGSPPRGLYTPRELAAGTPQSVLPVTPSVDAVTPALTRANFAIAFAACPVPAPVQILLDRVFRPTVEVEGVRLLTR
jgi:hypothetical protein